MAIGGLVFLSLVALIFLITAIADRRIGSRIYPNVYIDGRNVSNLSLEETARLFTRTQEPFKNLSLTAFYKSDPVSTVSAQSLGLRLNTADIVEQAYLIGRVERLPSRWYQKLTALFGLKEYRFTTSVVYDEHAIDEVVAHSTDSYNKPAKNALFSFKEGRVSEFRPEENGVVIEEDAFRTEAKAQIQSLKTNPHNITITLKESVLKPEITLAQSNQFGIEELIGEGQSDYTHSIPGREHNVVLGTSKFNGILIPKGETLSFNQIIGDISALTGYQAAYIIQNGKTVLGDGGGVCQVSTTLFRAALNSGLPIVNRTAHAYRVQYYENDSGPGFDATVFSPSVDLKIKNDTPAAILIQTSVDELNKLVYFKIYGKKDGRKVEISKAQVWDVAPPPEPSYEDDPTLPRGQTKQADFAAWGAKAKFSYKVTYPDQEVKSEEFYSVYRPWRAVFLVGTKDS